MLRADARGARHRRGLRARAIVSRDGQPASASDRGISSGRLVDNGGLLPVELASKSSGPPLVAPREGSVMIDFGIEREIARQPGDVFAYMTDPSKLATWQRNTISAVPDGPMGLGPRSARYTALQPGSGLRRSWRWSDTSLIVPLGCGSPKGCRSMGRSPWSPPVPAPAFISGCTQN